MIDLVQETNEVTITKEELICFARLKFHKEAGRKTVAEPDFIHFKWEEGDSLVKLTFIKNHKSVVL